MATYAALEKDEEVGLYRQEHVVKPESSSLKSQTSIFVLRALCAAVLLLSYTMGVLYAFGKSEAPIASAYATCRPLIARKAAEMVLILHSLVAVNAKGL